MNPEKMNKLSKPVVDIYNRIENTMLINIAKNLKKNKGELLSDPKKWQIQRLENLGLLSRENLKEIRNTAGLRSKELNKTLLSAGLEGIELNDAVLNKALKKGAHLIKPGPASESSVLRDILLSYQGQAEDVLNLTNLTMISKSNQIYRNIVNNVTADMLAGDTTVDRAMRKTINEFAEKGIPALVDKAGREWGTEGYVRMVLRSTSNNVVNEMQDERAKEWGVDLVEISSHDGARPNCEPYQGKIYSLSGNHPTYPPLDSTSIGEPDGLFGINCGHIKYPYVEGFSIRQYYPYPKEENDETYKESQMQRGLERAIRQAKNRKEMLEEIGDLEGARQADALIKERQGRMRDFIKESGRTRRYDREQIVS